MTTVTRLRIKMEEYKKMNKHERMPDTEKIKEILDVVSEKIPGLLKELSSLLYSPESAKKYDVRGIPTLLIFKDGTVVATKVGAGSESDLKAFIESNI